MFVLAALLHGIGPFTFGDQFLMNPSYYPLVTLALLPITFLLDALIQALFGNSLGKLIAGIRVETTNLGRPQLRQHAKRNLLVWLKGIGLGIPIISLFAMMACYMTVRSGRLTSWDSSNNVRVFSRGANIYRTLMAFGAFFALSGCVVALGVMVAGLAPQHSAAEIAKANEGLPLQIDSRTRMDKIEVVGRVVTYNYTLVDAQGAPSLTPMQIRDMRAGLPGFVLPTYCRGDKDSPPALPTYPVRYLYRTFDGQVAVDFSFRPEDCASLPY
jgi:hypothetical protein